MPPDTSLAQPRLINLSYKHDQRVYYAGETTLILQTKNSLCIKQEHSSSAFALSPTQSSISSNPSPRVFSGSPISPPLHLPHSSP